MFKTLLPFIFLVTIAGFTQAQMIRGHVTDEQGKPLPFTTIYLKGTSQGTSTNIQGEYFFEIPAGKQQVVFQYIGYQAEVFEIALNKGEKATFDVQLEPEVIQLKEIVVSGDGKDPAYYVIAQAIKKRKFHLEEVAAYKCNVYIKGMQTITKKPDKILGFTVPVDTGIVYLSESISELYFLKPDKIKERVISSKVSGNNRAFSYNQASEMLVNFYKNILTQEGLTERGIISPIANNAFLFYDYELAGIFQEDGETINKIKVIPRRPNDPAFSGFIYIIENSWRIHSVDLLLTKSNQIEFIDSLSIKQVYAPVDPGIWMMLSQKFTFDLDVFGFEGKGNFMAVHSNYEVKSSYPPDIYKKKKEEDTPVKPIKKITADKQAEELPPKIDTEEAAEDIFPKGKKFFNNEILIVEDQSNKKTETYWEMVRPVPLTRIEKLDYQYKDSIQTIVESKPYKDSMDARVNKASLENILLTGYLHRNSYKESYYSFEPLTNMLQYNTVEGSVINLKLLYTQLRESQPFFRLIPEIRYGFASERFYGRARSVYLYNNKKFGRVDLEGGSFVSQINEEDPIKPWINSFYTLVLRENYLKLYEKQYARFKHQLEYFNGFFMEASLEYANRSSLSNAADFSFFREGDRAFSPNSPANIELFNTAFAEHQALSLQLLWKIRFAQQYISRPERKYIVSTKYPHLNIRYKKGIDMLGSDINYDLIEFEIRHDASFGLLGDGAITASYGNFVNAQSMYFPDFRHFNGSRVHITDFNAGNYQLLDYYAASTADEYITGTYSHHFNGFLFNKLPLIRKTKVQGVASVNYLYTPTLGNYIELGFGIEHIFKVGRIDYYWSFTDGQSTDQGLRFGIGF